MVKENLFLDSLFFNDGGIECDAKRSSKIEDIIMTNLLLVNKI